MMQATSKKLSKIPGTKLIGSIRNPVTTKKDRDEQRFAQKLELDAGRRVLCRGVDGESRKERADDARQLNRIRKHAGDGHDAQHENEVSVLLILDPLEHIGTEPA